MQETVKKIWNRTTTILVAVVVLIAVLLVGPRLLGFQPFTVLSGSMEPAYPVGTLIYVKSTEVNALQTGDVITFMVSEDTVATHRIVEVIPDKEEPDTLWFRTKGDANESVDGALVHYRNVIGTPIFKIPKLGYLSSYIQEPPGLYVAICIGAILMLLVLLPELLWGKEETEKRRKEDENEE